jgi:hypothetical protein
MRGGSFVAFMIVSNERTQGPERSFFTAFPWVRLRFDRRWGWSAKSLPFAGQAFSVLRL